jgi:hypothetical protein
MGQIKNGYFPRRTSDKNKKMTKENIVTYTGNDNKNYNLVFNGKIAAEAILGEDAVIDLVSELNGYIEGMLDVDDPDEITIEIKNDVEKLGITIYFFCDGECYDTFTYLFSELREN